MIPYKQLSLADIFSDCQNKFENDKPVFLSLLENHIDIDEIIPISFRNHFYASTGRARKYPLNALLWALIIQHIFSIPTDQLLLTFLAYSKPLREFCGFTKVPDASKITRFKQDFIDDLQLVFDNLVDLTEPVCHAIDSAKADMTIFDSSGIEAFVAENNPKYANRIIKQLKAYAKANNFDKNYDPYKAAYGSMPTHASANPEIMQLYINGHFCYVFKFGIVTNGLGIIRHISFYNKNFMISHPEIVVEKKSDSPDEDKCVHDAKLLIPTLKDFFVKHPLINPKTFLGDAAFDSFQWITWFDNDTPFITLYLTACRGFRHNICVISIGSHRHLPLTAPCLCQPAPLQFLLCNLFFQRLLLKFLHLRPLFQIFFQQFLLPCLFLPSGISSLCGGTPGITVILLHALRIAVTFLICIIYMHI